VKRLIGIIAAGAFVVASIAPAAAMGSGDAYANMQVGVTYTVYEPSFTAGIKAQHVGGNDLCPKGTEQNLMVLYGKANSQRLTITEGNPMCSDIGNGETVLRTTINGSPAFVQAYCDPSSPKKCTRADVKKFGGHLEVTLPGVNGLRSTRIWIETYGGKNLSAQQLVRIAKSLVPVGS
jgi:hypothetical protein